MPNELVFPPAPGTSSSSTSAVQLLESRSSKRQSLRMPTVKMRAAKWTRRRSVAKSKRGARRKGMVMVEGIELGLATEEEQETTLDLTRAPNPSAQVSTLPPRKSSLSKRRKRVSLYLDINSKRSSIRAWKGGRSPSMPFFTSKAPVPTSASRYGSLPRSKTPYRPECPSISTSTRKSWPETR